MNGGYEEQSNKQLSEIEMDSLVEIFTENIACLYGSDLIFYPNLCNLSDGMTAKEMVYFALNYQENN